MKNRPILHFFEGGENCPIYTGLLKKKNLLGNRPILHFFEGGLEIARFTPAC
jgi:hypothetical protein